MPAERCAQEDFTVNVEGEVRRSTRGRFWKEKHRKVRNSGGLREVIGLIPRKKCSVGET